MFDQEYQVSDETQQRSASCICGDSGCGNCASLMNETDAVETEVRGAMLPRGRGVRPTVLPYGNSILGRPRGFTRQQNNSIGAPLVANSASRLRGATLVVLSNPQGNDFYIERTAANAWTNMVAAARRDGIPAPALLPRVSQRTKSRQARLWDAAVRIFGSQEEARHWSILPGEAVSRNGRVIELDLGPASASSSGRASDRPAYRWLRRNARRFGFVPDGRMAARWRFAPESLNQEAAVSGSENEAQAAAGAARGGAGASTAAPALGGLGGITDTISTGIAIFEGVQRITNNTNTVTSNISRFMVPNGPADQPWTQCEYPFSFYCPGVFDDTTMRFVLHFEHNGRELRKVLVRETNSTNLYLSRFKVDFVGGELSPQNAPVLSISITYNGNWDPSGLGEYNFNGTFYVFGNGQVMHDARTFFSKDNKVQFRAGSGLSCRQAPSGGSSSPNNPQNRGTSLPSQSTHGGLLRKGSNGPAVANLQVNLNRWLACKGYATISVSGQFDDATLQRVKMFQSSYRLQVDGIVGPMTNGKLQQVLSNPSGC